MANNITIAFDIYGTLADTSGVVRALAAHCEDGEDAAAFAARWRDKQLEYTFRRTAMGYYADFGQCTAEALRFVCEERGMKLNDSARQDLAAEYSRLPLFDDVKPALTRLREGGDARMFAFSNGKAAAVKQWLTMRGIGEYFADIVSADEVQKFKPSPQVYQHFLHRSKADADNTYLVSGNPFDIIGAQHAGIKGLWLNRTAKAVFDPWQGIKPSKTITSLKMLANMFAPAKPADKPVKSANKFITYQFNGKNYGGGRSPGLGQMVYDIIKHWANKNRPASYNKLIAAFPQTLRGTRSSAKNSLFAPKQVAEQRYAKDKNHPRHVRGKRAILTIRLGTGSEHAVSNQWGEIDGAGDIRRFIAHARNMGYDIKEINKNTPATQPVKIHVFIDLENTAKNDVACLLDWLKKSGLPMMGQAVTANIRFKAWDSLLNQYDIANIKTENTGKDAADAYIAWEVAMTASKKKAGDIICIIGTDQIHNKPAESALKSGFRVIRFGKTKPTWTTSNRNYRFFKIKDTIAGKSQFPEEWKTRPSGKK